MKKTILIVSTIFLIYGCKEMNKKIEQFVFDATKFSVSYHYEYKYKEGKKIAQIVKNNILNPDKSVISNTTITTFIYGKNGKIEKEISKCTTEDNSETSIYKYDSNDSLILKLTINNDGDTTLWRTYNEPLVDGKKESFNRELKLSDSYFKIHSALRKKIYDTTYERTVEILKNNLCTEYNVYNQRNQLVRTVENVNKDGKKAKELRYIYAGSFRMLQMSYYFDYSKSETEPDFYAIGRRNDTVYKETNEFYDGKLALTTNVFNHNGRHVSKFFFENDKLIGVVQYHYARNRKEYSSYTYYPNGDMKDENDYNENIQ